MTTPGAQINGLYNSIQEIQDNSFDDSIENARKSTIEMKISFECLEKRRQK